jgi:hypothetical protein
VTKTNAKIELLASRLQSRYGIAPDDTRALRRAEMTLHRWHELECGAGNDRVTHSIERDETSGVPYRHTRGYLSNGRYHESRVRVPDRERGALKRLHGIMQRYPQLIAHVQGDPRGCALHLVLRSDVGPSEKIESVYTRGSPVCI